MLLCLDENDSYFPTAYNYFIEAHSIKLIEEYIARYKKSLINLECYKKYDDSERNIIRKLKRDLMIENYIDNIKIVFTEIEMNNKIESEVDEKGENDVCIILTNEYNLLITEYINKTNGNACEFLNEIDNNYALFDNFSKLSNNTKIASSLWKEKYTNGHGCFATMHIKQGDTY